MVANRKKNRKKTFSRPKICKSPQKVLPLHPQNRVVLITNVLMASTSMHSEATRFGLLAQLVRATDS